MKTVFFKKFTVLLLIVFCGAMTTFAQKRAKQITPADKKALVEIFKNADPSSYRLVFEGKVYGKKRLKLSDLKETGKRTSPTVAGVKWTFVVGDRSENEVIYVYTEGMSELVSVIGKAKASQLKALASKYIE